MAKKTKPDAWRNRIIGHGEEAPGQLLANPANWRVHPKAQQDALAGVLSEVGWVQDIVVNRQTGHVVDGHLRVSLAISRQEPTIPVVYVDLSPEEEALVLATLDPLSAMAAADKDKLDTLLREVASSDAAVMGMLAELAKEAGLAYGQEPKEAPEAQVDRAAELQEKWQTARGQLWEIPSQSVPGKAHRLLCGDSTSAEDVGRLMGGEKATLCFTSPPYADLREYGIGSFDWGALMQGVFAQVFRASGPDTHIVVNLGLSHKDRQVNLYWSGWLQWCDEQGWPLFGWYVWDKGAGMPGEWNGRLAPCHEFLFHFNGASGPANKWIATTGEAKRRGARGVTFRQKDGTVRAITSPDKIGQDYKVPDSVIRIGAEKGRGIYDAHPAVFPPELPAFAFNTWTSPVASGYDPFLGSGTTMVAAEQTGRLCYGMEIEPKYVAVALERLEAMGLQPVLTDGG